MLEIGQMDANNIDKKFLLAKTKLQLKISFILLIPAIFISALSFLGEVSFYKTVWETKSLMLYSLFFIAYELVLLLLLFLVYKERQRLPHPYKNRSKYLVFLITYLTTIVIFCIVFIGRFYGKEIFFLSIINIVFGIVLLLNNKERALFLIINFILYIIGSYIVIPDSLSFFPDIGKAFSTYFTTFLVGKITYDQYKQLMFKSYEINELASNQKKTLSFLADELNLSNSYGTIDDNLEELNIAISTLLVEFSDSKKQLSTALDLANEASKAKEKFLANISHEIRTPLHAIIGLIRELNREDLNNNQSEYCKSASNAAEHLLSLVNNVLDFSKIESEEFIVKEENFSFSSTIDNMVSILKSDILKKGLKINYQKDQNINEVFIGDSKIIRQIIFNIVGNAIKFTNTGEIGLFTKLISDEKDFQNIEIIVKDTGVGMNSTFITKIFDKFTQAENKLNTESRGTGLGMSITKKLVDLLGGEIKIDSKINVGTKVSIKFKMKKGDRKNLLKVNLKNNLISLKSKLVLLVDDNKMNRLIARKSFENLNCIVIEAENGQGAIDILKERKVDIIYIDIQMPILNGVEATKIIRNELKINTPIIALTANAFKKDIDSYLKIGVNDYLSKPYDEDSLLRSIHNNINKGKDLYNLSALKKYDDIHFTKNYLQSFLNDVEINISSISKIIKEQDIDTLNFILHKTKPNIKLLEINVIFDDIMFLETYKSSQWDDVYTKTSQNVLKNLKLVQNKLKEEKILN